MMERTASVSPIPLNCWAISKAMTAPKGISASQILTRHTHTQGEHFHKMMLRYLLHFPYNALLDRPGWLLNRISHS